MQLQYFARESGSLPTAFPPASSSLGKAAPPPPGGGGGGASRPALAEGSLDPGGLRDVLTALDVDPAQGPGLRVRRSVHRGSPS